MSLLHGKIVIASAILIGASQANAAVISRDWKTPGDGLLTFDTVNKREWLDLSQTLLSDQFPGTGSFEGEIRESRYQYVVGQTAPGGLFEGFRVAKSSQVTALAQSAGIDTSTRNYLVNGNVTLELETLIGFTLLGLNGNKLAIGLINELDPTIPSLSFRRRNAEFSVHTLSGIAAGLRFNNVHLEFSEPPGVMLYRAIPEPSTLILIGFALLYSQRFLAARSNS